MKIGIITFHHAHNSGAMLQVLALQTYLQNAGHEVSVIDYRVSRIDRSYAAAPPVRKDRFEAFMNRHLRLSPLYHSLSELQKADHPYDAVIAGSDQIWNETILNGLDPAYFCAFGKPTLRRIIYGASIGSDTLSQSSRFLMQRFLQYPDFISVREESMLPLLRPLTDKALTPVLDPTLLLTPDFYLTLAKPEAPASAYIYLHYVHHSGENPDLDQAAAELSALCGLPILKNRAGQRFQNELPDCSNDGPAEFLSRIRHASYVVSDSFHANVFSILFSKHFLTVLPLKRPERLIRLLDALQLSAHCYREGHSMQAFLSLPEYASSLSVPLNTLRQNSTGFLQRALHAKVPSAPVSYFTIKNPFLCYGCAACHVHHPEQIRGMEKDNEGFFYPNTSHSKHVNLCLYQTHGAEPATNPSLLLSDARPVFYLGHHNALYEQMISYEGGLLPAFFRYILAKGGAVIGRSFDASLHEVHYKIAYSEAECRPFLSFCPQEAPAEELLQLIRSYAASAPLLVLATPCHLAAARSLPAGNANSVILLEQYCSGVYSSALFHAQLRRLHELSGQTIVDYNLASKHFTPSGTRVEYTKKDGSLFTEYRSQSRLVKAYYAHTIQRPSCYACTFRANFPCIGDLAIASVSPKTEGLFSKDIKIVSCLSVLTEKGEALYQACKSEFYLHPLTGEAIGQIFPASTYAQFPLTVKRPANYISPSNVVTAGPVI